MGHTSQRRKWGPIKLPVLQVVPHLGGPSSLPWGLESLAASSLSLAAACLKPFPPRGLESSFWLLAPLTCKQAWSTDLQLEVELIFHGVGHFSVQESCQAQLVPAIQGPIAKTMPVFTGKGAKRKEKAETGSQGRGTGQHEKTWRVGECRAAQHPCIPAPNGAEELSLTPDPDSPTHPDLRESLDSATRPSQL